MEAGPEAGALPVEVANPARDWKRFQKPMYTFLVSMLAAFTTTLVLMLTAICLAYAFRPGGLTTDEYVKLGDEGFMGHCSDCDEKAKYILVCDGEKQIWGRSGFVGASGMIYYLMNGGILEPVFDLQHWCNIQDLGNVMHGAHAVVWPFVLILANLGLSVVYDMKATDKRFQMGWHRMLQRNAFAAVIHGFVFAMCYLIASIADGSELNTAAQTVYVFSVISYALYIPGRLLLDNGQYFDKSNPLFYPAWIRTDDASKSSFVKNAITMASMLLLPLIYAVILILAYALEGRAFHPTGPMWEGIGYCVAEIFFVVLLNLPVFYFAENWEKQDIPLMDRIDPEVPDSLPPIYEEDQPRGLEDVRFEPAPAAPLALAAPQAELGDPEYEEITI